MADRIPRGGKPKTMLKRPFLLGLLAVAATCASAADNVVIAPGQLLVKPKANQATAANAAYRAIGATVIRTIPQLGWQTLRLKTGMTVQTAMSKLAAYPKAFERTEPNHIFYPCELPNDPMIAQQYSITKMQLSNAWGLAKGKREAVVAIVDTGVDINHPDLKAACVPGRDTADGDDGVIGTNPHGTHCAGIAAGIGNNGVGIAGISYGASIMPIKVFPDGFDGAYGDAIAAGLVWAADHGADVASMSFGGGGFGQIDKDGLDYAYNKNVVLVAAAGNNGSPSVFYPAGYEKCIAVGASDSNDAKASFSNYGADWVDVAAPGVGILSTVPNSGYDSWDGTSMACPNVAGVATLIISRAGHGALTNAKVREIIEDNCDNIGTWISKGRVNAYQAILHTGTTVIDDATPSTPFATAGNILTNPTSEAIMSENGISLTLNSARKSGVGLDGAVTTGFTMTKLTTDELTGGTITLRAMGDKKATLQIFVWDNQIGNWTFFNAQPVPATMKTLTFNLTKANLLRYMSNGQIELKIRTLVPVAFTSSSKGVTTIDRATVSFRGVSFGPLP